ncbi:ABC transporter substrate-binding protein [Leucobacter albus]|uniref:ABC transporter substrate-binding protein n=1 Tax=Leucobacter albus TaxID=272210 RepID=A0ABW3TV61_9MICO
MTRHRKRLKLGILGAVTAAVALTACSPSGDGGGETTEATQGGEAVFAIDTPIIGLDPNVTPAAQDARVMRQVFDNLVAFDANGELIPWLATGWELSDDGLEYTFTLRDDVTFHDDTPFNGEAVCFNLDRIKDPVTASMYAASLIGPYASCVAPDETTAIVRVAEPFAPFMATLTSPFLSLVSPTAAAAVDAADFNLKPVGSGPYVIESYTPQDRVELVANENYNWAPGSANHQGRAYLDRITFQIVPDATVRLGSLRSGGFQAVGNVPETEAQGVEQDPGLEFVAQSQSGAPFQYHFNSEHPPFDDPTVRAALRQGFDIESAVSALYLGVYERAWGPLSPTTYDYDENRVSAFDFDPEAAAAALEGAGWELGADGIREKAGQKLSARMLELTPNREKRQDLAEFFKANMKDIGVDIQLEFKQSAGLLQAGQEGDYDILTLSLVNVDPNVLYSLYAPEQIPVPESPGFNYTRVAEPELSSLLLRAQQELDPATRTALHEEIQADIVENARSIAVYVPTYTMATNGIQGLRFDAEGYPVWYDVSIAN